MDQDKHAVFRSSSPVEAISPAFQRQIGAVTRRNFQPMCYAQAASGRRRGTTTEYLNERKGTMLCQA